MNGTPPLGRCLFFLRLVSGRLAGRSGSLCWGGSYCSGQLHMGALDETELARPAGAPATGGFGGLALAGLDLSHLDRVLRLRQTYAAGAETRAFVLSCCSARQHVSIERGLWLECIVGLAHQERHDHGETYIYLLEHWFSIAPLEFCELARPC